jgi:hypothetical protein
MNNASGREGWRVRASEASLATVSPIFDAMKQLTISPKVCYLIPVLQSVSVPLYSLAPPLPFFLASFIAPGLLGLQSTDLF